MAKTGKRQVKVYEVKLKGSSPAGDILEIRTNVGNFRTAQGGMASQKLRPWVFPAEGRVANIIVNSRGTVDDLGYL